MLSQRADVVKKWATCYYGLPTDCTNAITGARCRQCAERLTDGVIEMLRPAVGNSDEQADRSIAYKDDAMREHASCLAEAATAKRLSNRTDESWHEYATNRIMNTCLRHYALKERRRLR
ncbi:MAG: hypothetical protein ACXVIG_06125 [Halobacteriota archaeon]